MKSYRRFMAYAIWIVLGCNLFTPAHSFAQLNKGGIPFSFQYGLEAGNIPAVRLSPPDRNLLDAEDNYEGKDLPYRYAVNLPTTISFENSGSWEDLSGGDRLWRVSITAEKALALACYFEKLFLPEGATLFLYSEKYFFILGAYTSDNHQDNGRFATELIPGDQLTLEYFEPATVRNQGIIRLSEVSYAYRGVSYSEPNGTKGFGSSGACEVNINCPEGASWQNQKRAVVRIAIKIGPSSYWCTGTLLNNVRQDYTPWLLTADHCGATANAADISQWVFYFHYEAPNCPNPGIEPGSKTLTGAVRKAASGGGGQILASDLYLVLLNNQVPIQYNPWFCGWNRQNVSSTSGTGIHHPQGDIKKISTYTSPTFSTAWGSTPNTHWGVKWIQTQSGHGVTEPGSSGSPLLDNQGRVVGQLSGGDASCSNLNGTDYYGKFSYSWDPPGSDSTRNLHHWLDPDNTGASAVQGLGDASSFVIANFTADQDTFIVGQSLQFTDLSSGNPTSWHWTFEGAEPTTADAQHPGNIYYGKTGVFSVTLRASNAAGTDTLEKKRYITVLPNIFPNPHSQFVTLDLGTVPASDLSIEIFDLMGREVKFYIQEINTGTRYGVYLHARKSSLYYMKVRSSGLDYSKKIMLIKTP